MFGNLGLVCCNRSCCDKDLQLHARFCKSCGEPLPNWAARCGFAANYLWRIRDHARKLTKGQGPELVKLAYVELLQFPLEDLGHMLGVDASEALALLQSMMTRALAAHGITAII